MVGDAAARQVATDASAPERIRALESELADARARLRDFLDVSSDWVWEMDEELCFSSFSGRLRQVSGLDPATLVGRNRVDLMRDATSPAAKRHLADLAARRPFRDFAYDAMTPGGRRVFKI